MSPASPPRPAIEQSTPRTPSPRVLVSRQQFGRDATGLERIEGIDVIEPNDDDLICALTVLFRPLGSVIRTTLCHGATGLSPWGSCDAADRPPFTCSSRHRLSPAQRHARIYVPAGFDRDQENRVVRADPASFHTSV
jgi:hypothetical protein